MTSIAKVISVILVGCGILVAISFALTEPTNMALAYGAAGCFSASAGFAVLAQITELLIEIRDRLPGVEKKEENN